MTQFSLKKGCLSGSTLKIIAIIAMAMEAGLTSAIINPCDVRMMETIKSCDIILKNVLYADSYLDL